MLHHQLPRSLLSFPSHLTSLLIISSVLLATLPAQCQARAIMPEESKSQHGQLEQVEPVASIPKELEQAENYKSQQQQEPANNNNDETIEKYLLAKLLFNSRRSPPITSMNSVAQPVRRSIRQELKYWLKRTHRRVARSGDNAIGSVGAESRNNNKWNKCSDPESQGCKRNPQLAKSTNSKENELDSPKSPQVNELSANEREIDKYRPKAPKVQNVQKPAFRENILRKIKVLMDGAKNMVQSKASQQSFKRDDSEAEQRQMSSSYYHQQHQLDALWEAFSKVATKDFAE